MMKERYPFSMENTFVFEGVAPEVRTDRALWFAFKDDELLVIKQGAGAALPLAADFSASGFQPDGRFIGFYNGVDCYAARLPEAFTPTGTMALVGLRKLFGRLHDDMFTVAGRAIQLLHWENTNRYCGRCGVPMEEKKGEVAGICPACGLLSYPRLSPAVIMTVEREREILLARSAHFPKGMFSTLAGFVEPGETLEAAVIREVKEEVGVDVCNVRYFGSQPWPFPHSLMVGFTADYDGGELCADKVEIEDAGWFSMGNMPKLPSEISIARALIDDFLKRNR